MRTPSFPTITSLRRGRRSGSPTRNCAAGNGWRISPPPTMTIVATTMTRRCAIKGKKKEGQKEDKQGGGRWEQDTCKHEGCARWMVWRGACITHGMTIYHDFGLLDKELPRRQLLENKAASDDGYSDDHDDDDESLPREKAKKATGQKEEHQGGGGRWGKKNLQVRGMRQMCVSGRSLYCKYEGCAKWVYWGGVCIAHGAIVKNCSREGCTSNVKQGGLCMRHGGKCKKKYCRHDGCTKQAVRGGVCTMHGAGVRRCSHEGCPRKVIVAGVCITHGARVLRCRHKGCKNQTVKGGVCRRHGASRRR